RALPSHFRNSTPDLAIGNENRVQRRCHRALSLAELEYFFSANCANYTTVGAVDDRTFFLCLRRKSARSRTAPTVYQLASSTKLSPSWKFAPWAQFAAELYM